MLDPPSSPVPAMSPKDIIFKGSVHQADQAEAEPSDNIDGAPSEEESVRQSLVEERMNRTMSLPECMCLRLPRVVSYAEVGDPGGYPVCVTCWYILLFVLGGNFVIVGTEYTIARISSCIVPGLHNGTLS